MSMSKLKDISLLAGLWGLVVIFVVIFILKSIQIHEIFGTSAYDLGIFQQAHWLLSQFEPLFNTVRGLHSYVDHFRYIDLLYIPLYYIIPSIYWAFFVQALSVGVAGLLIYAVGRHYLIDSKFLPVVVAVSFLLNPVVHNPLV